MVRKALGYLTQPDAPFYLKPRLDFELLGWLLRFARRCNWADYRSVTRIKAELLQRSRERIAQLVRDEPLSCEFEELGTLYAYRDARELDASRWTIAELAAVGLAVQELDGARARALEPALNDSIVGAHYNPGDAHLRPDRYVAELARRARELGARFETGCEVTAVRGGERPEADTTRGRFRGRAMVFALGAWSPRLARALGLKLPVQPGKGYSATFDRPVVHCPRIPVVCKERSVCVTAWSSGFRLGSTMEFAGYDTSLNRVRLDALSRGAREYLREVPATVREEWYGWRPMTYDDLPIIGPSPRDPNVVLATGHGMLGVTLSAITGLLVSEVVTGKPTSLDIAPYSPARFA
jgi:D-amino-acid dehydrogenase